MGSFSPAGAWRTLRVLALCAVVAGTIAAVALAAGPGGWDHLGDRGTPGTQSLDAVASALTSTAGVLYVGGSFNNAGGIPAADRIATWNGSNWGAVSSSDAQFPAGGGVLDIAVSDGKVYAGGSFTDAGGNANADFLAVWNGTSWAPFCTSTGPGASFNGNVHSLQIIGQTLYVGGAFQDGAGFASADYLLACNLANGASSPVVHPARPFSGPVYALSADGSGTLYAGGNFDVAGDAAADYVAYLSGATWNVMGGVTGIVRAITTVGTDVYVGTNGSNVGGIPQADHVARWDGSAWRAVGADSAGGNGWFPAGTSIYALTGTGSYLFATGMFQDANGDLRADRVAFFDGDDWHPIGSNGGSDGPLNGSNGLALALVDRQLFAAGDFTTAGGDNQARSVASFALSQVIAYPTPTVTAGPSAGPTPTVTPGPSAVPTPTVTPAPDAAAPRTSLRKARIDQARRKATFSFASSESGSRFVCKLDNRRFKSCASPKTYKRLASGAHTFRVKARDRAGNVDASPVVKRFRIRRR